MSRIERRSPSTQHRVAGGEVRASKSEGVFTALAVRYGVVDMYGSVWAPGCFDVSLSKRLPVILFGHDHGEPVGRATSWRPTPDGPEITAQLDLSVDVPKGRQAAAQLASGTITDVSVGFLSGTARFPTDEDREKWPGVKEIIITAEMLELSLVSIGAVPGAVVTSSRSASLARDLALGRITPERYRSEMDLERDMEEALTRAARILKRPRSRFDGVAQRIVAGAEDPVKKWVGIVEAQHAAKEAAEKARADRERLIAEQEKAAERRRHDKPFTSWV